MSIRWNQVTELQAKGRLYACGYCGAKVRPSRGYIAENEGYHIAICPHCTQPTFLKPNQQTPGASYGNEVSELPGDIKGMYTEVRKSMQVSAYTVAVLGCRKILMHIGVEKGAEQGKSFAHYIDHLDEQNFFPPGGKEWVDQIRQVGNIANHEIRIMAAEDAKALINFVEMILKFIYEFPSKVAKPE